MAVRDQDDNSLVIDLGDGEDIRINLTGDKSNPISCSASSSIEASGQTLPVLMTFFSENPEIFSEVIAKTMLDYTLDPRAKNVVFVEDAQAIKDVFVQRLGQGSDVNRAMYALALTEWSMVIEAMKQKDIWYKPEEAGAEFDAVCTDEDKAKAAVVLDELFAPYVQQIALADNPEQSADPSLAGGEAPQEPVMTIVTKDPAPVVVTAEPEKAKELEKVESGVAAPSVEIKSSIPFDQETLEVQALLRLGAGIDPKLIDGKNGPLTKAAMAEYAKANDLAENISVHDLHNHLLVRFGEDADFRSLVRLNAVSAIDDASREGVKAAQVVLNLEAIHGLNDKPLKVDGVAGENTNAARVVLEAKIKAVGAEKRAEFEQKKFTETTIAEFKKNIDDLTAPESKARRIAGLVNALAVEGIDDGVLDKRGTKLIAAAFNEVAPGVLDEKTLTRRAGHLIEQYDDVSAYHKYDRGAAYVPKAGDVIFYKDGTAAIVDGVSNVKGQNYIHVIGGETKDGERFVMTYPEEIFTDPDKFDSKFNYKAPTDFYGHDYGEMFEHKIRGIGDTQELLSVHKGADEAVAELKKIVEPAAVERESVRGADRVLPGQMVEPPKL